MVHIIIVMAVIGVRLLYNSIIKTIFRWNHWNEWESWGTLSWVVTMHAVVRTLQLHCWLKPATWVQFYMTSFFQYHEKCGCVLKFVNLNHFRITQEQQKHVRTFAISCTSTVSTMALHSTQFLNKLKLAVNCYNIALACYHNLM